GFPTTVTVPGPTRAEMLPTVKVKLPVAVALSAPKSTSSMGPLPRRTAGPPVRLKNATGITPVAQSTATSAGSTAARVPTGRRVTAVGSASAPQSPGLNDKSKRSTVRSAPTARSIGTATAVAPALTLVSSTASTPGSVVDVVLVVVEANVVAVEDVEDV